MFGAFSVIFKKTHEMEGESRRVFISWGLLVFSRLLSRIFMTGGTGKNTRV